MGKINKQKKAQQTAAAAKQEQMPTPQPNRMLKSRYNIYIEQVEQSKEQEPHPKIKQGMPAYDGSMVS